MGTATRSRRRRSVAPTTGVASVIAEIRAEIGACKLCPGLKPHRKLPSKSFGTTQTGYMLVGEAAGPGARPFDDAAGEVLRKAVRDVGDETHRDLEDLFFLSQAARCGPVRPDDAKRTRSPTRRECRACSPFLAFEMRALHPRLVVTLGGRAAESVLQKPVKIGEIHGRRHRVGDVSVLTLTTPSPFNRVALRRLDLTIESYGRWLTGLFGALIDDLAR